MSNFYPGDIIKYVIKQKPKKWYNFFFKEKEREYHYFYTYKNQGEIYEKIELKNGDIFSVIDDVGHTFIATKISINKSYYLYHKENFVLADENDLILYKRKIREEKLKKINKN